MDWLQSLLWDPSSVAHIVLLYAFVVATGVYLGKIKIFGVSLGVTFVLFAGILMGHFGFTADTHILHFIREFGLILFVFCIGLQVGPSFFSSFKKGGMTLNLLAVGIVVLNIAVALGLYYLWNGRVELPMMVGILYGAVTNTPGLGAANEALNQLSYNGPQIALGYACAYPLGVVGIIGSIIAIRYIFRVNMTKEEESLKTQSGDAHHKPHMMSLEVRNESISGKTLIEIKEFLGRKFVCSHVKVGGGHAGHNGLRSIIDKMGSRDFSRIRTGIGNPPGKMAVADYVLKQLRAREAEDFQDTCARAADSAGLAIVHGVIYARDHVNGAASANGKH